MANMTCGFCKFTVPWGAKVCAHCDAKFTYKFSWNGLLDRTLLVIFLPAMVLGFILPKDIGGIVWLAIAAGGVVWSVSKGYKATAHRDGESIEL